MQTNTPNYNLVKPVADEFYDIEIQNGNMKKIDTELQRIDTAVTHLADMASQGLGKGASLVGVHDANNHFIGSNVEEVLNELFQFVNNGKTDVASVIGLPATSSDTLSQLKTHIQNSKNILATNLLSKGQTSQGTVNLITLVNRVADISTGMFPVVFWHKPLVPGTIARMYFASSNTEATFTKSDGATTVTINAIYPPSTGYNSTFTGYYGLDKAIDVTNIKEISFLWESPINSFGTVTFKVGIGSRNTSEILRSVGSSFQGIKQSR